MKNLLFLASVAAALYFGYRWWQDNMEPAPVATSPSRSGADVSGDPVRQWERAPDAMMEMNKAMQAAPPPAKAARDVVRQKLGQTR